MADGLVIKHPTTGQVIFNSATVTSHVRATVETNGGAGSLTIPELVRGAPFIIQALPSTNADDTSESYNMVNLSISGDQLTWSDASGPMRVVIGSRAIGSGAGSTAYAGLVVRRDGGVVQVSSNDYTMQLSSYGSLILTPGSALGYQQMTYGSVTVAGVNPVLAFRAQDGRRINMHRITRSGGQTTFFFRSPSSNPVGLIYWAFDTAKEGSLYDTDAALVLKDESGVKAFDSRAHVLNIVDVVTQPNPTGFPPDDDDFRDLIDLSSMQAISTPAGRTYAVIQATPSHIDARYVYYIGTDIYGEPIVGGSLRDIYFSTAQFSASGEVYVGFAQFYGNSSYKGIEVLRVRGDARHTIIDVTNLPSAAMPNPSALAVSVSASSRDVSVLAVGPATTQTQAVTASASGGTGQYSYQWQFVSGDAAVAAFGSTTGASFRTQSANQSAGVLRGVWRARVTDSNGLVGYSGNVTFTHNVTAADVTAENLSPGSLAYTTNNPDGWAQTPSMQIKGTNAPVTLRVERYDVGDTIKNMDRLYMEVHRSPNGVDQWEKVGTIQAKTAGYQYIDFEINPGWWFVYSIFAQTDNGRRQSDVRMVVYNMTGNQTLSDVTQRLIVDADNNHSLPDYSLDPIDWENISGSDSRNDYSLSNSYRQLNGINRTVNIRATITNVTGNLSAGSRLEMFVSGTMRHHSTTLNNGAWAGADFSPGEYLCFVTRAVSSDGQTRSGSYTVEVRNQTTGQVIDTFTVNMTVAGADTTPDAINLTSLSINTNSEYGRVESPTYQVTGINRTITLGLERYNLSNNRTDSLWCDLWFGPNASSMTNFRNMDLLDTSDWRYINFDVQNGWCFRYAITEARTNGGRKTCNFDMALWNRTNGALMTQVPHSVVVDADNNYTPPDQVLDAISIQNFAPNSAAESATGVPRVFQITGINQRVDLRLSRWNTVNNGNVTENSIRVRTANQNNGAWESDWGTLTGNGDLDFYVFNGQWVEISIRLTTNSGRATGYYDAAIRNQSTGGNTIATFNMNGTVDNDNNYNLPSFNASLSPTWISGSAFADNPFRPATASAGTNLTVNGASGSYTVAAEFRYQNGGEPTATVSTAGVTVQYSSASWSYLTGQVRLQVRDSAGRVTYTNWVDYELQIDSLEV